MAQIGKVTAAGPTGNGVKATLAIDTSPKIPADVHAAVRSMSAVGENTSIWCPARRARPIWATDR